jgi:DNA-binding NarL/FixJ family response regulator
MALLSGISPRGRGIALAETPGFRIVGEAATGTEARRLCRAIRPAVTLLDHHLARPSVAETLVALGRLCPETRVMVLASPVATAAVRALVAVGAVGAVSLDEPPAAIARAIAVIASGGTWCSPPFLAALAQGTVPPADGRTAREDEGLPLRETGRRYRHRPARLSTTSPARSRSSVRGLLAHEDDCGSGVA